MIIQWIVWLRFQLKFEHKTIWYRSYVFDLGVSNSGYSMANKRFNITSKWAYCSSLISGVQRGMRANKLLIYINIFRMDEASYALILLNMFDCLRVICLFSSPNSIFMCCSHWAMLILPQNPIVDELMLESSHRAIWSLWAEETVSKQNYTKKAT